MKRKDLQHLKLDATSFPSLVGSPAETVIDGISVNQNYTEEDLAELVEVNFASGFPPFTRGIHPTMYVTQPWQVQLALSETTLEKTRAVLLEQLNQGHNALTLELKIATDALSDNQGHSQAGLVVESVEDMKELIRGLPLPKIDLTLATTSTMLPLLALYCVAAQEVGMDLSQLQGRIQYNGLQVNRLSSSLQWLPQQLKSVTDSVNYLAQHLPKFKAISICNQTLKQLKVTADIEIAYSLAQGRAYLQAGCANATSVDLLASHTFYSWTTGVNFFMEIAKMRASRLLWSKMMLPFNLKNPSLAALPIYAQTTREYQTERLDYLTRTTIEASTSVFGGVQGLCTPLAELNSRGSIYPNASAVQSFLQHEAKSCLTVDPWAGSYYLEKLTLDLAHRAWTHLEKIETAGGLTEALEKGVFPSVYLQDTAKEIPTTSDLKTENHGQECREKRDEQLVQQALEHLRHSAKTGEGNLLALAIAAAKIRATAVEIQNTLI